MVWVYMKFKINSYFVVKYALTHLQLYFSLGYKYTFTFIFKGFRRVTHRTGRHPYTFCSNNTLFSCIHIHKIIDIYFHSVDSYFR